MLLISFEIILNPASIIDSVFVADLLSSLAPSHMYAYDSECDVYKHAPIQTHTNTLRANTRTTFARVVKPSSD